MPFEPPTHDLLLRLLDAGAKTVVGLDEVGRGSWAGPVMVGAAVTDLSAPPEGLTDSKLLTPKRREAMAEQLSGWVTAYASGQATVREIDDLGMTEALRRAATRAIEALPVRPDAVILDGKHDYLGKPWRVTTVIKGDQSCVTVAAASVLVKVERDALMVRLGEDCPEYDFGSNAGYPSPIHKAALRQHGPSRHHRISWAFMDGLPEPWRTMRKVRVPEQAAPDEAPSEQLALEF
ncbi:ribonuclease HII [Allostreptomyces psammosilenae]|uniref:Ribonuclease HII n=1 Tax=Allostreptomyces psammosilenae TaxID=1892865 RepID=A0A852ZYD6_9ACTN|nr:ribonuclease HII [Allostreptomyces psammosilenae]NYI03108.1 ribonuclease HII [Allostreptomyces psammosilenae]